ncbi:MAG TPA: DUF4148 domain-containing protein [Burkholderiaceae bacterium]
MKTAQIIAAAVIFATSVSAMAQQAASQDNKDIPRGKTRAEVIAELKQAEAEGKSMPTSFAAYDVPAKANTSNNTAVARK